jgi:hypothetical protein
MLTFVEFLMTTLMFSTDPWLATYLYPGPKSTWDIHLDGWHDVCALVRQAGIHAIWKPETRRVVNNALNSTPCRVRSLFLCDVTVEEGGLGSTAPWWRDPREVCCSYPVITVLIYFCPFIGYSMVVFEGDSGRWLGKGRVVGWMGTAGRSIKEQWCHFVPKRLSVFLSSFLEQVLSNQPRHPELSLWLRVLFPKTVVFLW